MADIPQSKLNPNGAHPAPAAGSEGPTDGDLLGHFVRRTDNTFAGVEDKSLIGEDIGDDEVDENGDPIEDR